LSNFEDDLLNAFQAFQESKERYDALLAGFTEYLVVVRGYSRTGSLDTALSMLRNLIAYCQAHGGHMGAENLSTWAALPSHARARSAREVFLRRWSEFIDLRALDSEPVATYQELSCWLQTRYTDRMAAAMLGEICEQLPGRTAAAGDWLSVWYAFCLEAKRNTKALRDG
jgi:hypothetical protein